MTITEFLLARIAEDEDRASLVTVSHVDTSSGVPQIQHVAIRDRVLAECEAKRRIVERCSPRYAVLYRESDRLLASAFDELQVPTIAASDAIWPFIDAECVLRDLASVYADHPDFDDEWRAE